MTVAGEQGWVIKDPVLQLRVRGSREPTDIHDLAAGAREVTIGASADRTIQLVDPSNMVSRHHARLVRQGAKWTASDDASRNGILHDGEPRLSFDLAPGVELGVGSIVFVAESARLIALRDVLDRWIGWSPPRHLEIDRALRSLRLAAALRATLVLRASEGDSTFLARRLHLHTLGADRPFVVASGSADGLDALHAAAEGTICVDAAQLPGRWSELLEGLRTESFKARMIMCAAPGAVGHAGIVQLTTPAIIDIPALSSRGTERERVLREYAAEAATDLGASIDKVRPADWERLIAWPWNGISDLASDAYRLVALREWGVTESADRLNLSHSAQSRWATRRKLATF